MVHVRLERDWTDGDGNAHAAGDTIDVDAATLARLEADGVVSAPEKTGWAGPTGGSPATPIRSDSAWAGPTSTDPS